MTDINTPEQTLHETKALMGFDGYDDQGRPVYRFDTEHVENEPYPHGVTLSTAAWLEFGRPDEVTVTVAPGDVLNEEPKYRPSGFVAFLGRLIGYLSGMVVLAIAAGLAVVVLLGIIVALQRLAAAVALG